MFPDKVAAMEHDLIFPCLFHVLSPTCVACAVTCGVEHLCVVVITLMIPAMGYYRRRQKGPNLTSSEFKFQPRLEYSITGEVFTSLCVTCVFLCEDKKQNAFWTVRFEGCTFLLLPIRLPWWAPVCIQTCDRPEGPIGGDPPPLQRCQMPDSEQMLTNTNAPERPPVCVCMYGFVRFLHLLPRRRGEKWQVVDCVGVERAAMGISRFTTLVRKLTNQSCFSFRTAGVNGAPSFPPVHTRRTRRLCRRVDSSCLSLSLLWSLLSS